MDYNREIVVKIDKTLGYAYFMDKGHPLASSIGRVYYHRHIASVRIGRWLAPSEHVHHLDGNKENNTPNNLEVISPSEHAKHHCHAMMQARGANPRTARQCQVCSRPTLNKYFCSDACSHRGRRKADRPPREDLIGLVKANSFVQLGKMFGVSDNAIRKWCKHYGLPVKRSEIMALSSNG